MLFDEEIAKVSARLETVASSERAGFVDGSIGYDHACLAVLRLAAMLEDASPFADRFDSLDEETRLGIITTRNIISHIGYGAMDDEVFWHTVTVDIPAVLTRLGLI